MISTTSLGPIALRKIVQDSSADIQKQSLDLGGIVWLEHLNLVVGDMDTAKKFYIDFLGFTAERDNLKSNHYNIGQQQFHLAATDIDASQRVTGSIGLTVPSLQRIRDRLDTAKEELHGTLFSIVEDKDDKMMTVWMLISLREAKRLRSRRSAIHQNASLESEVGVIRCVRKSPPKQRTETSKWIWVIFLTFLRSPCSDWKRREESA